MHITQHATVWAPDCGKVKLRSAPTKNCDTYWNIPTGANVNVINLGDEWSEVEIGEHSGYMMTKYLMLGEVFFNAEDDTIVVDRKRLEDVYEELGDILGMRG